MLTKVSEAVKPNAGQTKTRVRFAWLPVIISGVRIWFESYEQLYVWEERLVPVADGGYKVGQWTKVSEKLVKWMRA